MKLIGIHSGKGGVGKTTVAINLAYLLAENNKIGLVDADIDCPNIGKMLGITDRMKMIDGKFIPIEKYNMKIVSTDFMSTGKPILLRGPQKHSALMQFMKNTNWGDLDYIIVDLPPGTSDVPMSLMQFFKPEMIMVTTPQNIASMDVKKSFDMAKKFDINIIGLIENMSGEIFGNNGENIAKENNIDFLGSIPLDKKIAQLSESGKMISDDETIKRYFKIAIDKINLGE